MFRFRGGWRAKSIENFFPSDFVASGASMTPNQTVDRPDRANTTNTVSTNVSVSLSTNPRAAF
jgi:hypothetical protein